MAKGLNIEVVIRNIRGMNRCDYVPFILACSIIAKDESFAIFKVSIGSIIKAIFIKLWFHASKLVS